MKPRLTTNGSNNRFPVTDYNYHSVAIGEFNGHCAKIEAPSFLNISRDYFENEAPRSFISEAAFFAMITITAAVPVVSGAFAAIALCRSYGVL